MLLNRILDLEEEEEVFLAEESFEDLIELPVTQDLLSSGIDADKAIEINGGFGVALHLSEPAEFWLVLTEKYSGTNMLDALRIEHSGLSWKKAMTSEDEFFTAIAEYFSISLAKELFCESCNVQDGPLYIEDRIRRLESFLESILPSNANILEICSGSGMATQSLQRLGHRPLSMEFNRCELCQGLKAGKLDPSRSFVMDARMLDRFFKPGSFDVVVGFMMGMIDQINWNIWKDIILTASDLASRIVLYTVYTEKEAQIIARALNDAGWNASLIDNRDASGIYDQWAVRAERKIDGKINTTIGNDEVR